MIRHIWTSLRGFVAAFGRVLGANDIDMIAAGVAFYGMLSVFPAFAFCIAVFGLIADPVVISEQLELMHSVLPPDVFDIFRQQIERLLSADGVTLGWASAVSLTVALWSARAGVGALVRGLNSIAGVRPRSGLLHMLAAVAMTLSLIGVSLVALLVVVVLPVAVPHIPIVRDWSGLIFAVRWVVALFVLFAALGILYRYGPNSDRTGRVSWFTPGAVCAVILWYAASYMFSYYLSNFGSYNQVYGSLGAVVAMLMWLYISSYLVLLGAVLNVALATLGPQFDAKT